MVYTSTVRRIQLYFEEEMDDELASEAARRGLSKAALVRDLVRQTFHQSGQDPIDSVIGMGTGEPVDNIDAAIYGSG